jgi:hypothetical protein
VPNFSYVVGFEAQLRLMTATSLPVRYDACPLPFRNVEFCLRGPSLRVRNAFAQSINHSFAPSVSPGIRFGWPPPSVRCVVFVACSEASFQIDCFRKQARVKRLSMAVRKTSCSKTEAAKPSRFVFTRKDEVSDPRVWMPPEGGRKGQARRSISRCREPLSIAP